MEQELDKNGLTSLNVIRYWKYVLKNKQHPFTVVIAKPIDRQILMQMTFANVVFQVGVIPDEELIFYRGLVMLRENLLDENAGEFWSKVDYVYCEENDPIQCLANACGASAVHDEKEMLGVALKKQPLTSIERVNNFEKAKEALTL